MKRPPNARAVLHLIDAYLIAPASTELHGIGVLKKYLYGQY